MIKPITEREWVASKSTTPAAGEDVSSISHRQLLRFIKADHLVNKYWQIAWDVEIKAQGVENIIVQERPWLAWRSTFTFRKGSWFRWG